MDRLVVVAEFSFQGGNNDELCFKKGDIITVTQREEGGWWEGTLQDKTGWFPSNYVKEMVKGTTTTTEQNVVNPYEMQEHRAIVLKTFLETEEAHLTEINELMEKYLNPLKYADILNDLEYSQLLCNITDVLDAHGDLLSAVGENTNRVGKIFLDKAPYLMKVHETYSSMHPKAVDILETHKDKIEAFMAEKQSSLLTLTAGLSKPFRRLQQYSSILREFERHMDSDHADRGDTQRSCTVYSEMSTACTNLRKQKEFEIQILTGPIRGWQGKDLTTFGEIIHMSTVLLGKEGQEKYMVLFPKILLILSVSQRMSAFIFEDKIICVGVRTMRIDDNTFELSTPADKKLLVKCKTPTDFEKWLGLFDSLEPAVDGRHSSAQNLKNAIPQNQYQHKRSLSFNHYLSYTQIQKDKLKANCLQSGENNMLNSSPPRKTKYKWTIANLKPLSPLRPFVLTKGNETEHFTNNRSMISKLTYEEDSLVLKVIEGYCFTYRSNGKNAVNTKDLNYEGKDPMMRKLCASVKQIQGDIKQMQSQITEERSNRIYLQRLLISHLESLGKMVDTTTTSTTDSRNRFNEV